MTDEQTYPSSPEAARALFRGWDQQIKAELAAEREAAGTPEPAAPPKAPADPNDPREATKRAAADAQRAELEQTNLAEAGRALLRERGRETGFAIDKNDTDAMSDQEVLLACGLIDDPDPRRRAEQERVRQQNELVQDPIALALHLRETDQRQLRSRWWQLADDQREQACRELGLSFAELDAQMKAEMRRKF